MNDKMYLLTCQVICFMNICHPAWQETDYIRDIGDTRPTLNFTLDEAICKNVVHFFICSSLCLYF